MGKLVGYCRISTHDQSLDLQKDALIKHGVEADDIYTDTISGATWNRPGLDDMKKYLRKGDTVVVWRLDRLGRSLKDLIEIINEFESQGIGFKSLTENINTTSPGGKLFFHIFGAISEFERNLIRERTKAGLFSAKARGRHGGRPPKMNEKKRKTLVDMYESKTHSIQELCEIFNISKATLFRQIKCPTTRL